MNTQAIPCPNCKDGKVHFTTEGLLTGQSFQCAACEASISLSPGSTDLTRESLNTLEKMKHKK